MIVKRGMTQLHCKCGRLSDLDVPTATIMPTVSHIQKEDVYTKADVNERAWLHVWFGILYCSD